MQSSVVEEIDYVVDKDVLNFEHRWKLKKWVDQKKLEVEGLQSNPRSIYLWENNFDNIMIIRVFRYFANVISENDKIIIGINRFVILISLSINCEGIETFGV